MIATWTLNEVRRAYRNRRTAIFTLAVPILFYVFFANGDAQMGGLTYSAYLMVSMATFGALGAVFGTGGRISLERSTGWNRQLRLTALKPRDYIVGKAVAGYAVALPSLVAVFVLGATLQHVTLPATRWLLLTASILLALPPIAALGIWIGYAASPDNMGAISGGVYTLLSLLGGLWLPASDFPRWLADLVTALPIYWVAAAGRSVLAGSWLGWHGTTVLAGWTVVFAALAMHAYRGATARA